MEKNEILNLLKTEGPPIFYHNFEVIEGSGIYTVSGESETINDFYFKHFDLDADFWDSVKANLEKVSDVKAWWDVAKGPVTPVIEDENAEYITAALNSIPPAPWDESTWSTWTSSLKESTGRKGRQLFMPLRQALTGMDHGPDMPSMLLLIGPEKATERLSIKKAA